MNCLYCGKKFGAFSLFKRNPFCTSEHGELWREREFARAKHRLLEATKFDKSPAAKPQLATLSVSGLEAANASSTENAETEFQERCEPEANRSGFGSKGRAPDPGPVSGNLAAEEVVPPIAGFISARHPEFIPQRRLASTPPAAPNAAYSNGLVLTRPDRIATELEALPRLAACPLSGFATISITPAIRACEPRRDEGSGEKPCGDLPDRKLRCVAFQIHPRKRYFQDCVTVPSTALKTQGLALDQKEWEQKLNRTSIAVFGAVSGLRPLAVGRREANRKLMVAKYSHAAEASFPPLARPKTHARKLNASRALGAIIGRVGPVRMRIQRVLWRHTVKRGHIEFSLPSMVPNKAALLATHDGVNAEELMLASVRAFGPTRIATSPTYELMWLPWRVPLGY